MGQIRRLVAALALLSLGCAAAEQKHIEVYVSDSHAESFYYLADKLCWSGSGYRLILIDAHHDLMPVMGQDSFRPSLAQKERRQETLQSLRRADAIQCYAWILPLCPSPVKKVEWYVGGPQRARGNAWTRAQSLIKEACGQDFPRYSDLLKIVSCADLKEFSAMKAATVGESLIISVDLDSFSGYPTGESECRRVMAEIVKTQGLDCVTVAISRNYLASQAEAESLLAIALSALSGDSRFIFKLDLERDPIYERSAKADQDRQKYGEVPYFTLSRSSPRLRALAATIPQSP